MYVCIYNIYIYIYTHTHTQRYKCIFTKTDLFKKRGFKGTVCQIFFSISAFMYEFNPKKESLCPFRHYWKSLSSMEMETVDQLLMESRLPCKRKRTLTLATPPTYLNCM